VIRVDTIEDLFDTASLLANQPIPAGRRVGIVTNAGGPGILAADALEANGLEIPELSAQLREEIGAKLPAEASTRNPVDLIASGGPDQFGHATRLLLHSGEVDAVMVIYVPTSTDGAGGVANAIRECQSGYDGNVALLSVFMQAQGAGKSLAGSDGRRSIPTYTFPEAAAHALARAAGHGEWRMREPGEEMKLDADAASEIRAVVDAALDRMDQDGGWLDPDEVDACLRGAGLRTPTTSVAHTPDEANAAAAEIGGPVVIKVISDDALHKSDVGGVVLDVQGAEAVTGAFDQVTAVVATYDGVLVQEMIPGGHEVLIGMAQDPNFGPLVVFGLGGIYVELLKDVAFRLHPLTDVDAQEMMTETKGYRLLEGYRNNPEGDVEALQGALQRVSALISVVPELAEMDLNPVKVLPPGEGICVVDARMRLQHVEPSRMPAMRDLPGVTTNPPA
jgi:acyl-CoA synthetase (NDP forming)